MKFYLRCKIQLSENTKNRWDYILNYSFAGTKKPAGKSFFRLVSECALNKL